MHELEVAEIVEETAEARTIRFSIPQGLTDSFKYQEGQFVTIEVGAAHGINPPAQRCYSLSSSPSRGDDFSITIKEISGGVLSPVLVRKLNVGDRLKVSPPAGRFVLQEGAQDVFFAAGSGITPIFSMMKQAMELGRKVHLVYSNRDESGIIFNAELAQLESDGRIQVHHVLSQPGADWQGLKGRISNKILEQLSSEWGTEANYYMCGPEAYMSTIEDFLLILGVDGKRIHYEKFTVAPASDEAPVDGIVLGEGPTEEGDATISVVLNGESHQIEVKKDESILDAAVRAELTVPYSCMEGVCFACIAKLEGGKVAMVEDVALDDDEIHEDRKVLTCQSRVLNSQTVVNFDEG